MDTISLILGHLRSVTYLWRTVWGLRGLCRSARSSMGGKPEMLSFKLRLKGIGYQWWIHSSCCHHYPCSTVWQVSSPQRSCRKILKPTRSTRLLRPRQMKQQCSEESPSREKDFLGRGCKDLCRLLLVFYICSTQMTGKLELSRYQEAEGM